MPAWFQRAIEAAAATVIGACVFYWLAPLVPVRRTIVPEVEALRYMVYGAIAGACVYIAIRLRTVMRA